MRTDPYARGRATHNRAYRHRSGKIEQPGMQARDLSMIRQVWGSVVGKTLRMKDDKNTMQHYSHESNRRMPIDQAVPGTYSAAVRVIPTAADDDGDNRDKAASTSTP